MTVRRDRSGLGRYKGTPARIVRTPARNPDGSVICPVCGHDGTDRTACPQEGCGNEEMDRLDADPDYDYCCHWCGGMFEQEEADSA